MDEVAAVPAPRPWMVMRWSTLPSYSKSCGRSQQHRLCLRKGHNRAIKTSAELPAQNFVPRIGTPEPP
eukprot:5631980-Amphidinium_carterae.1